MTPLSDSPNSPNSPNIPSSPSSPSNTAFNFLIGLQRADGMIVIDHKGPLAVGNNPNNPDSPDSPECNWHLS